MATWYATTVLGLPVSVLLWLFFLYSCAGVVVEGVFCLLLRRRLEVRLGLLYLPLRPVYGLGGTACTLVLTPLLDHPVVVFALAAVICSVVEFVAGWAVERAFRTVSWDYSDKRLNLRGRICAQYSLAWGVLATAALYACHPAVAAASRRPPGGPGDVLLTVLLVLTLLSAALTLAALARARRRVDQLASRSAGAAGPSPRAGWERLVDRLVPDPVLIHSLPRMGLSAELREVTRDRRQAAPAPARSGARAGRRAGVDAWRPTH